MDTDTDLTVCEDCGNDTDDPRELNGREVCTDCSDNYSECAGCGDIAETDYMHEVTWQEYNWPNGYSTRTGYLCDDCARTCDDCRNYFRADDLYERADRDVCESCSDDNYAYCDDCDAYYAHDDSDEHNHTGCDCESPALSFAIRNDGSDPLPNDQTVTVTLAAGTVTDEGMADIARALRNAARDLPRVPPDPLPADYCGCGLCYGSRTERHPDFQSLRNLAAVVEHDSDLIGGPTWQTRQGNLPKRLSRYAWNTWKLRLSPDLMSEVGNIGSAHSQGTTVQLAVTRDLNLPADEFYHDGSCWWGGYSESRCALKNVGGFGLRTFDGMYARGNGVSGRAWVIPLRLTGGETYNGQPELVPTFDTMTPDAFVVFNGYGDLSGYTGARIMAHLSGMTYRKVGFECDYMYVNSGGYLVAPESLADHYTDKSLRISLDSEHDSRRALADADSHAALAA
jgi:hypothetical protein